MLPRQGRDEVGHFSSSPHHTFQRTSTMAAVRRITKEFAELQSDSPPNVSVAPDENNIFHWVSCLSWGLPSSSPAHRSSGYTLS